MSVYIKKVFQYPIMFKKIQLLLKYKCHVGRTGIEHRDLFKQIIRIMVNYTIDLKKLLPQTI